MIAGNRQSSTRNPPQREKGLDMLVYVLNNKGKPLMPCSPPKARHLLKDGKAKVVRREPFTIKLLHGSSSYKQEVVAGMDTGSKTIGCAAIGNGKVLYQAEIMIRQDVSGKMQQRAMYRKNRRNRKTRYRPARWSNRASMRAKERLAPSIQSKVQSHLRERDFVESVLPISLWKVELAQFDIHKITNPQVSGVGYQNGNQKGFYNIKAYVLHRDDYKCQSGQKIKHTDKLEVHHIQFRRDGGSDTPSNLTTLCAQCHKDLHNGVFSLRSRKSKTKHATEIGIVKGALMRSGWVFEPTFGYETKFKREQCLGWSKSHAADAVAIACEEGEIVCSSHDIYHKRHVSKGDYQQTNGSRSEKRIPTGKLFGLRKFDLIKTPKGIGFVKGKRSSGYFAIMSLSGNIIHASVNVKSAVTRILVRTTTLTERECFLPSLKDGVLACKQSDDGAGLLNGSDTFTRTFMTPPIQHEAADRIEQLENEIDNPKIKIDRISSRLLMKTVASCQCETKTPVPNAHDPSCKYRVLMELYEIIKE